MEVTCLSTAYRVRCLEEADVPQILRLCSGNPQFYQYHPPLATADSVRADIRALPPGKMPEDKFYVGYFAGDDLSTGTPSEEKRKNTGHFLNILARRLLNCICITWRIWNRFSRMTNIITKTTRDVCML